MISASAIASGITVIGLAMIWYGLSRDNLISTNNATGFLMLVGGMYIFGSGVLSMLVMLVLWITHLLFGWPV